MKNLILVIIGIIVVLLLGVSAYFLLFNHPSSSSQNQQSTNPFGASTSGTTGQNTGTTGTNSSGGTTGSVPAGTVALKTTTGSTILVPDPTKGKTAIKEGNYNYYYLTDNQDTEGDNAQFDIEYGTDSSISIILLKEPLSAARLAAEQSLRSFFPLSDSQLCALQVSVAVPSSINDQISGRNLGLSFCPGSAVLP